MIGSVIHTIFQHVLAVEKVSGPPAITRGREKVAGKCPVRVALKRSHLVQMAGDISET